MQHNFEDLLNLQDYELIFEVRDAIIDKIRNLPSEEDLEKIPEIQFYLIAASIFDLEMQNGGLCQFLLNAGNLHGPVLAEALRAFGAEAHGRIFEDFCRDNGIDFSNLSQYSPPSYDSFMGLYHAYPFDEFDEAYFALDRERPLEGILGTYIRKDILRFVSG